MNDELASMREYLLKLSFDYVTISGTYEWIKFDAPDKTTALLLRHSLEGDVEFAGGIAVTNEGRCSLFGRGT